MTTTIMTIIMTIIMTTMTIDQARVNSSSVGDFADSDSGSVIMTMGVQQWDCASDGIGGSDDDSGGSHNWAGSSGGGSINVVIVALEKVTLALVMAMIVQ